LGAIITGTILKGKVKLNETLEVLPLKSSGRIKNIQIFHQNVDSAKAGDRVGINVKNLDVKKIYRGCIATNNPNAFDYCDILEIKVNKNKLFKPETQFGTQVHVTIGMFTTTGKIYPYFELDNKKIQSSAGKKDIEFNAILWLHEKVLINKGKSIMLLSRLDLPPTTLRILGSAKLIEIHKAPPLLHKFKIKKGKIQKNLICIGLAQSAVGAKKIVGRQLEPPFTKILDTFGTKGAVIVGVKSKDIKINRGDPVVLKELRSFRLKKI
jgi:selenocysteine-specific elongation factor